MTTGITPMCMTHKTQSNGAEKQVWDQSRENAYERRQGRTNVRQRVQRFASSNRVMRLTRTPVRAIPLAVAMVLAVGTSIHSSAVSAARTEIVIVGTVHAATPKVGVA